MVSDCYDRINFEMGYKRQCLPSRRLPVECAFSPDGLFEARFRVGNTSNLREGEQLLLGVSTQPTLPQVAGRVRFQPRRAV